MLTLTHNAAEAVRVLVGGTIEQSGGGLRISPGEPTPSGVPLQVEIAAGPEATDQLIEEGGASVFLESQVADALDDKVLDATLDGEQVRFEIREQGPGALDGASPSP